MEVAKASGVTIPSFEVQTSTPVIEKLELCRALLWGRSLSGDWECDTWGEWTFCC